MSEGIISIPWGVAKIYILNQIAIWKAEKKLNLKQSDPM